MRALKENRANVAVIFALVRNGAIHPAVHETYDLEYAFDALEAMRTRRLVGKAVITMEQKGA